MWIFLKIKEVEQLLDISCANIRYYEKEGLLSVARKENKYREYNENDISQIKKIIIFRKLGFTIDDVRKLLDGTLSLQDGITQNIHNLEEQMQELQGAMDVNKQIEKDKINISDMDENIYWNLIFTKENNGSKFFEIWKDYLNWQIYNFDNMCKYLFLYNFKKARKKYGVIKACGIILLICFLRGLSGKYIWHESFWERFLYPFFLFAIVALLIFTPIFILMKKRPKIAGIIVNILLFCIIAFFVLLFLFILVLIIINL